MKLKEFKARIDKLYAKYGDVDVCINFKTGGDALYSFEKEGELLTYTDNDISPDTLFDTLCIEEITDVQETYGDVLMTKVNGVCISNYKQEVEEDEN